MSSHTTHVDTAKAPTKELCEAQFQGPRGPGPGLAHWSISGIDSSVTQKPLAELD